MANATPPVPAKSNTVYCMAAPPSFGVKLISSFPSPGTTKSVARYYACKDEYKATVNNYQTQYITRISC